MQSNIFRNILTLSLIIGFFSFFSDLYLEIWSSLLVLILLFYMFWQEKTPPVILAALLFQWLTISIGYIYILVSGVEHKELLGRPYYSIDNINQAYWLSIIGLCVFALGLKVILHNHNIIISDKNLPKYDTFKVIVLYVVFSIVSDMLFRNLRYVIPGLAEPINMLGFFKWSLFFMMIYLSFVRNEYKKVVYLIMAIEILIGFSGFFSAFKDIFFVFPIVYLSFNKLTAKQSISLIIVVVIVFNIGVVWSYVKVEQRMYLTGGKRSQSVKVSKIEALQNLYKLTNQLNKQQYEMGLIALVQRIYYLEYFSATIKNIPAKHDFFEGEIWENAIKHVLMPRILFPNKKAIDDSKQTSLLTGITLAGAKQGTSISVGYMAESYADFGKNFMFVPIFLLGLLVGFIYKTLSRNAINSFWSLAIVFPMFFMININGLNAIKVTGRLFMFFIVFLLINKFILPWLHRFLLKKS